MSHKIRVRFAPSPTGALHIGGVRTALYNYLFAKKHGGDFILRIEDTDQGRFVSGAEDYILSALKWVGLEPDESPERGGPSAPYRQSERKDIYRQFALQLVQEGHAYFAFDTPEELDQMRADLQAKGVHTPTYNAETRTQMKNSLTMADADVMYQLAQKTDHVIRLKVDPGEKITFTDQIRGEITFDSEELDDKVLMKADGMPTYHLANVVDDHLMEISHVIRGEEWLSSTAHHVLIYKGLGLDKPPIFAHLPLILKPTGKGKLSKRDGKKLGIPVFPLSWNDPDPEERFTGFRETGFDPAAVINFLAFLGWSPGTEQEIFKLDELVVAFDFDKVSKSGARFDYDKALWFNQQYLKEKSGTELQAMLGPWLEEEHKKFTADYIAQVCELMKERVHLLPEILKDGYYFFEPVREYDEKAVAKRVKPESIKAILEINDAVQKLSVIHRDELELTIKSCIEKGGLGLGVIMPALRLAVAGSLQGPDLFDMIALIGKERFEERVLVFQEYINSK